MRDEQTWQSFQQNCAEQLVAALHAWELDSKKQKQPNTVPLDARPGTSDYSFTAEQSSRGGRRFCRKRALLRQERNAERGLHMRSTGVLCEDSIVCKPTQTRNDKCERLKYTRKRMSMHRRCRPSRLQTCLRKPNDISSTVLCLLQKASVTSSTSLT